MISEGGSQVLQVQFLSNVDIRRLQADVNRVLAMGPAEDVVNVELTVADIAGRTTYTAMILVRAEQPLPE